MTEDEALIADLATAVAVLGRIIAEARTRPLTEAETEQMRLVLAGTLELRAAIASLLSDDDGDLVRRLLPAPEGTA